MNPLSSVENFLKNSNYGLVVAGLILIQLAVLFYHPTQFKAPSHMQADTQTDHLSIAYGFLDNGFHFFEPQTYRLNPTYPGNKNLETPTGITRVDFPIHEYVVAFIMKISGSRSPAIFRSYTLFFGIIGLLFLFRLGQLFKLPNIKSGFLVAFIFFLPVFAYHLNGFIPSIPAISTAIIGYYFFFQYKFSGKSGHFWFFLLFLSLSALVRTPFTIFVFATFLHDLRDYWKLKRFPLFIMIGYLLALALVFGHSFYNDLMQSTYGSIFMSEYPSTLGFDHFIEIVGESFAKWRLHYFTIVHYIGIAVALFFLVLALVKKYTFSTGQKALRVQLILVLIGSMAYSLLMLTQFHDYDFYFLDTFVLPIVFFTLLFLSIISNKKILLGGLILLLIPMGYETFKTVHVCADFDPNDAFQVEMEDYKSGYDLLEAVELQQDLPIGVLFASSSNIPLLHLNRQGYINHDTTASGISEALKWPVGYFICSSRYIKEIHQWVLKSGTLEIVTKSDKLVLLKRPSKQVDSFHSLAARPRNYEQIYSNSLDFDGVIREPWFIEPGILQKDTKFSGEAAAFLSSERPYGLVLRGTLKDLGLIDVKKLEYDAVIQLRELESPVYVCLNIEREKTSLLFKNHTFHDTPSAKTGNWFKVEGSSLIKGELLPSDFLSFYIWNPNENEIYLDDFSVRFFK